jgi:hypothetical protein
MNRRLRDAVAELDAYRAQRDQQQPDLFTTIAAVTKAAGTVWTLEVLEAIVATARRKPTLTVEDIPAVHTTICIRRFWSLRRSIFRGGVFFGTLAVWLLWGNGFRAPSSLKARVLGGSSQCQDVRRDAC